MEPVLTVLSGRNWKGNLRRVVKRANKGGKVSGQYQEILDYLYPEPEPPEWQDVTISIHIADTYGGRTNAWDTLAEATIRGTVPNGLSPSEIISKYREKLIDEFMSKQIDMGLGFDTAEPEIEIGVEVHNETDNYRSMTGTAMLGTGSPAYRHMEVDLD